LNNTIILVIKAVRNLYFKGDNLYIINSSKSTL
jgi:hypothetical protein